MQLRLGIFSLKMGLARLWPSPSNDRNYYRDTWFTFRYQILILVKKGTRKWMQQRWGYCWLHGPSFPPSHMLQTICAQNTKMGLKVSPLIMLTIFSTCTNASKYRLDSRRTLNCRFLNLHNRTNRHVKIKKDKKTCSNISLRGWVMLERRTQKEAIIVDA